MTGIDRYQGYIDVRFSTDIGGERRQRDKNRRQNCSENRIIGTVSMRICDRVCVCVCVYVCVRQNRIQGIELHIRHSTSKCLYNDFILITCPVDWIRRLQVVMVSPL